MGSKIVCLQCVFWTASAFLPSPAPASECWNRLPSTCKAPFENLPLWWPPEVQAEGNTLCFMRLIDPQHMICYKSRNRLFETFHLSSNTREVQGACLVFQSEVWMFLSRWQRKSAQWSKERSCFVLTQVLLEISLDPYRSLQINRQEVV